VAVSFAVPATAGTKDRLEDAKAELAAIQAELDQATAEWHASLMRLEATKADIADTQVRIHGLEDRISTIDSRLTRRAVLAFTDGPASTIDVLLSSGSFTEFSDRLEFLGQVAQVDVDLVLEQEVAQEELRRERDGLLDLQDQQEEEAERLEDIQERIDADLDQISSRVAELTAQYEKELAAQRALELLGQTPSTGGGGGGGGSPVVVGSGAIQVCPVAGPNSFVDSFGWPRAGHTHQGIDLISPAGTPVVAAHAGSVSHSSSSSGGIQAYVQGSAGYSFYAHLSGYSSASGSVGAGTVIGYVGSTGNAGSTNHLHFEWHPGGGSAVNPYSMLVAVC
jgi:murein DD-endopeptidase MepM/ murein hydrolase activator NlpD